MPALGRTNKPVRVETLQQRRGRRSQRHTPRPAPETLARAQERSYGSQAVSVAREAARQRARPQVRRMLGSGGLGFGIARDHRADSIRERARGMGALRDRAARQVEIKALLQGLAQEQQYSQPRATFNTQTRLPYDPEIRARRIAELRANRTTGLDLIGQQFNKARRTVDSQTGIDAVDRAFALAHEGIAGVSGPLVDLLDKPRGGRRGGGSPLTAAAAVAPGLNFASERQLKGLARNALEYPLLAVQVPYELGAAGIEAVQGDTSRAEKLGAGLLEGVIGLAAQGRWDDLGEYVQDNPLFALQELRGAKAVAGRGAGATMRSGAFGQRARDAASTRRADLDLGAGRMADRQHYSPDVLTKAAQVALERIRGENANKPRGGTDRRQRARADFQSDMAVSSTRSARTEESKFARQNRPVRGRNRVTRAVDRVLPTGKTRGVPAMRPEADVVSLVMQRVVRSTETLERDLRAELQRLDSIPRTEFKSSVQYRANRAQADAIRRVLDSPKALANAHEIARSADALTRRTNELEGRAIGLGALDAEAAARAKLFPYAQTHMDAEVSDAPFKALRAEEVQAARNVRAARQGVVNAQRGYAKAVANARVSSAKRKTSPALQAAEKAVRDAQRELRKAQTRQHDNRRQVARSLVRAERQAREASRSYLRRDKGYGQLETDLRRLNNEKQKLRQDIREARGKGEDTKPLEEALAAKSAESRSAQGRLAQRAKALMDKPVARTVKGTPEDRVFYRGGNPGEKPKSTGFEDWDRSLFMSHDRDIAKLYGDTIETIVAKPGAKIVRAGTPAFEALRKRAKAGPYESVKIMRQARKEGKIDVLDFRRSEVGAIVLNEKAVVRNATPRKGKKVLTGRASVARAQRRTVAPKATMTKPAENVGRARDKVKEAQAAVAREQKRIKGVDPKAADALWRAMEERKVAPERVKAALAAFDEARSTRIAAGKGGKQSLHLTDRDGRPVRLTNEGIIEHMRRNGVPFDDAGQPIVAYLPHRSDTRGARAYYQAASAGRRDITGNQKRLGEAQRKGTYESSYDLPTEHLIRLRGVVERIEQHDRLIRDVAITKGKGEAWTWEQATNLAENLNDVPGATKVVPYRLAPGKYDQGQLRSIIEKQDPETSPDLAQMIHVDFQTRLQAPHPSDSTAKNVVLVPEEFIHRLEQQMRPASDAGKIGNIVTSLFRTTVLPFSTKWLVGNSAEAALRLSMVAAGPNSHRIGRAVIEELRKLDADQAHQVEAALFAGLHFGQRGLQVTRRADQFEHTGLRVPAQAIAAAGRLPGPKQLIGIIRGYTNAVFSLNRHIEQQAQIAAFGKWSRREMQEFTGSWAKATKAQEEAVKDVARGLLDTKNIHDAARYMDETLGKYSRFSPGLRRAVQSGAPFLPWFINSVRFVYWTLPAKHPIKTALLLKLEDTIREEWEQYNAGLPPGSLRASIPVEGGVKDLARFTPFGFPADLHGGDPSALLDPALPQVKSAALALWGLNFTGRQATVSGGDPDKTSVRLAMAANSLLEAFVPGVAIARRVMEGGATPYDDSNILSPKTKPGTDRESAANRILNPIRTVPIGGKARGGGTASDEVQRLLQGAGGGGAPRMDPGEVQRLLQGLGG